MTVKLVTGFPLTALSTASPTNLMFHPATLETVREILDTGIESYVDSRISSHYLSEKLKLPVAHSDATLQLKRGDTLVVYDDFRFFIVTVQP